MTLFQQHRLYSGEWEDTCKWWTRKEVGAVSLKELSQENH